MKERGSEHIIIDEDHSRSWDKRGQKANVTAIKGAAGYRVGKHVENTQGVQTVSMRMRTAKEVSEGSTQRSTKVKPRSLSVTRSSIRSSTSQTATLDNPIHTQTSLTIPPHKPRPMPSLPTQATHLALGSQMFPTARR